MSLYITCDGCHSAVHANELDKHVCNVPNELHALKLENEKLKSEVADANSACVKQVQIRDEENERLREALEQIEAPPMFKGGCKLTYEELAKLLSEKMGIASYALAKKPQIV